jgi:cell division protein ZipA
MDAATLRLILLVVGAAFLLGLYLWERQRARQREDRDEDWDTWDVDKREPNLGPLQADESDFDDASMLDQPAATDNDQAADTEPEAANSGQGEPELGELLIQLYVVTLDAPFPGDAILAAAKRCKLVPGEHDIFHRQAADDGAHAPLFSMANLVNPGTFPFASMDDFETRGLALFAQLRGDPSDLMVFDEMLHAARTLADELGGEVQERGRTPLSTDRAKALRGQVSDLLQREQIDTDF